ncbi:unnamed protein product [Psylliodes chrysocephalus]|uniref:Uncharacterized protein n=1 Tax=Psylliodes chrysocephalus TaxID=3402493 RepID=A0A9P0CEN0_9CUCU|nr:unnamed protein product [Psylliodes chrysocephala]
MDFSENYQCKYNREIQSAHFGGAKPQISLHTVVWYYKSENGEIKRNSFCSLSENTRHDHIGIFAYLQPLFQQISEKLININKVHFLSDEPTTQYRNKNMIFVFAFKFVDILKPSIMTWNFSEADHGKRAPDSIVEQVSNRCYGIQLQVVTEDSFQKIESECSVPNDLKAFKGNMSIHQITWNSNKSNTVLFKTLSCLYCTSSEICSHYHLDEMVVPIRSERIRYSEIYSSSFDKGSSFTDEKSYKRNSRLRCSG